MRLLLGLSHLPHPEGSAAGRCSLAMLRGLRAAGHEVTVVAPQLPWDVDGAGVARDEQVEVVPVEDHGGWRARIRRLTAPRSLLAMSAFGARMAELAADHDAVLLDELDAARVGAALGHRRWAVHVHCLVGRDRDPAPPWTGDGRDALELSRAERWTWRTAPALVASSAEIAAEMRSKSDAPVTTIPLALTPEPYDGGGGTVRAGHRAGLIGTASWPPTADAIRHAVRLWPRVTDAVPGAELVLAGRGLDVGSLGLDRLPTGVTVVGEVGSASAFLDGLDVLFYPLGRGSGAKVKVLEALAVGVPVVTTADGAEGVAPADGVLVAGDDDALVTAVTGLLQDDARRRAASAAATVTARRSHGPDAVAAALEPLLESLARRA